MALMESSVYKTSDILHTLWLWWEEWGGTSLVRQTIMQLQNGGTVSS